MSPANVEITVVSAARPCFSTRATFTTYSWRRAFRRMCRASALIHTTGLQMPVSLYKNLQVSTKQPTKVTSWIAHH